MSRLLVLLALCLPVLHAQTMVPLGTSRTIAEALTRSGFQDALTVAGAPDGLREVTSSSFAVSGDLFAAGYYYADDVTQLHVSVFDRAARRWLHAGRIPQPVGSVLDLAIDDDYVIVNTHASPSAGRGLVFRRADLQLVSVLQGFHLHPMPGGRVRYSANMVHFAPTHRERLMVFDGRSGESVELFPGLGSKAAAGLSDDFDRSFTRVAHAASGRKLAVVVVYWASRLPRLQQPKAFETLVSCTLQDAGGWSCDERAVAGVAEASGFSVQRNENGWLAEETVNDLVRAALK